MSAVPSLFQIRLFVAIYSAALRKQRRRLSERDASLYFVQEDTRAIVEEYKLQ